MSEQDRLWAAGEAYEPYVGRWSRLVAPEFVRWLEAAPGADWVDVGCGTGELTKAIVATASPQSVRGADPSDALLAYAQKAVRDARVSFTSGDAQHLPFEGASADYVVSGLVLNFADDPLAAVKECARVTRPGGAIAAYVWDYAGEMQMIRHFFNAAVELNPAAMEIDEGERFPICNPAAQRDLFASAGLRDVEARAIDVPTMFADFDDYWTPFLAGGAPAPHYAMSRTPRQRDELRDLIRSRLPISSDGSISLIARAWAVKGVR